IAPASRIGGRAGRGLYRKTDLLKKLARHNVAISWFLRRDESTTAATPVQFPAIGSIAPGRLARFRAGLRSRLPMSRKSKQFGVSKHSRRRQKRKKREHALEPVALVHRRHATVVQQLVAARRQTGIALDA